MDSNPALTSVSGLHSLETISGYLAIRNNTSLPTCEAEALRDLIGVENIGRQIVIAGNNDGGSCE